MREARHLVSFIGQNVRVTPDDGPTYVAQLDAIGPTGCYVVHADTGDRKRVAAWRIITSLEDHDA